MTRHVRNFDLFKDKTPAMFGGANLKSHAKSRRPLSAKHAVHLVLKSEHARGAKSLLGPRNAKKIDAIVHSQAKKAGVRVYHYVNVGGHLHLVIRIHGRQSYAKFIRAVTGLIARHVLGAERNAAKGLKFWQARPFTRLVTWGRDYNRLRGYYMEKNRLDAVGGDARFIAWGFSVVDPRKIQLLEAG